LSSTGIFIRTRKPLKPGVPVNVSLHVDNDCTICIKGWSVRATKVGFAYTKNGMGVQLSSESEEYRYYLNEIFS
jgi:Tfp pilus assembly protein PilZ